MLKEAKTHIEKVETKALKPTLRVALQLPPFRSELPMVTVTFHPATDALDKLCDAFEKSLLDWVGKEKGRRDLLQESQEAGARPAGNHRKGFGAWLRLVAPTTVLLHHARHVE